MSFTKNKQSPETITKMARAAFPDKTIASVTELTEGLCNAAYMIEFTDSSRSVLKIASGNTAGYLSNEIGMMETEVKAMNLMRSVNTVKVAKVQYYDKSQTICSGSYFFMEALEGQSYSFIRSCLNDKEIECLEYESGQAERMIASVTSSRFGFLGSEEYLYDSLYDFVHKLFENVLHDMSARSIPKELNDGELFWLLEKDKPYFDEVTRASLTHWDMWDGNIFVSDKHICGIIDWERAMWAEPLLDDRFRSEKININMLRGYGQTEFSYAEKRRLLWYDLFLYMTMKTEEVYRGYGTAESTAIIQNKINDTFKKLSKGNAVF